MDFTVQEPPPAQQGTSFDVFAVIKLDQDAEQSVRDSQLVAAREYFQRPTFKQDFQRWVEKNHPGCGTAHGRSAFPVFPEGEKGITGKVLEMRHSVQLTRPL
jgi:hypothetical protein